MFHSIVQFHALRLKIHNKFMYFSRMSLARLHNDRVEIGSPCSRDIYGNFYDIHIRALIWKLCAPPPSCLRCPPFHLKRFGSLFFFFPQVKRPITIFILFRIMAWPTKDILDEIWNFLYKSVSGGNFTRG